MKASFSLRGGANLVDDGSRLPQVRALPGEAIMALAELGAIVGTVAVLAALGFFVYKKYLKN